MRWPHAAKMLSLDAPVSGGTGGAEAGTLTLMVGGDQGGLRQRPSRSSKAWASAIVHCGEAGAGQAAKICNNMMLAINMLGVCEGFSLAEKLGLSRQAIFDVVSTSSGQSWALTNYCPVPGIVPTSVANNDYKPGFMTALLVKDLTLAQEAAQQSGTATPMGAQALATFRLFMTMAQSDQLDYTSVMRFVRGSKS